VKDAVFARGGFGGRVQMDLQKVKDEVLAFGGCWRRCRRNYKE
jgi:hypothetical protein